MFMFDSMNLNFIQKFYTSVKPGHFHHSIKEGIFMSKYDGTRRDFSFNRRLRKRWQIRTGVTFM